MRSLRTKKPGSWRRPLSNAADLPHTSAQLVTCAAKRLRAAGIEDAGLEAQLLLAHALGITRRALLARLRDAPLPTAQCEFEALLNRRLAHEPAAYILGRREFYGIELACSPAALVPRPESELLVDLALDWLRTSNPGQRPLVVDVGTGSGAIALAIAVNAPEVRVLATDRSRPALSLAQRNARSSGLTGPIGFVHTSLLAALNVQADLIVANLPYVASSAYQSLQPEIRDYEPEVAVHAGPEGIELIVELLHQARGALAVPGLLLAEHDPQQAADVRAAAATVFPHADIATRKDLAGLERALVVARS
jgi:release factor glutamine methyltransferase